MIYSVGVFGLGFFFNLAECIVTKQIHLKLNPVRLNKSPLMTPANILDQRKLFALHTKNKWFDTITVLVLSLLIIVKLFLFLCH